MLNEASSRKEQEIPQSPPVPSENAAACQMHGKDWLKGGLTMAICCAAPLLLVAAIAFFGLSLGALAIGALSLATILACPIGMFMMMRMVMKNKK
jgi:hypothetical protein